MRTQQHREFAGHNVECCKLNYGETTMELTTSKSVRRRSCVMHFDTHSSFVITGYRPHTAGRCDYIDMCFHSSPADTTHLNTWIETPARQGVRI